VGHAREFTYPLTLMLIVIIAPTTPMRQFSVNALGITSPVLISIYPKALNPPNAWQQQGAMFMLDDTRLQKSGHLGYFPEASPLYLSLLTTDKPNLLALQPACSFETNQATINRSHPIKPAHQTL